MDHRGFSLALIGAIAIALAGCEHYTQTTSGGDYLRKYEAPAKGALSIDKEVRQAAAVEPLLRFPARIGLARIAKVERWHANPELTGIPAVEVKAWTNAAQRLGPSFGEFVPVSPILAQMFTPKTERSHYNTVAETIEQIRLGAARQHLDAVLIYESEGTADSKNTPLSITEWTLIGAFVLPTQDVEAVGTAQALLLDVRNGYPYGIVHASANDSALSARFNTGENKRDLAEAMRLSAVEKLAPEVERMMRDLRTELAEKRQAKNTAR